MYSQKKVSIYKQNIKNSRFMRKTIILLFALCLMSACKPTLDYDVPMEVQEMATSRFQEANGVFYELERTHEITETPVIGNKKYRLYIEARHRATGKGKTFIYEYEEDGDSYKYIGTSTL